MDLARAKGEALVNMLIIYSNEKYNRVMLNDVGKENEKKNNNNNFARAAHFFVHLFTVVACVPVRIFFFLSRSFSPCWPLLAGIKFSCCCSSEIRLCRFLSLALALCRSFSR